MILFDQVFDTKPFDIFDKFFKNQILNKAPFNLELTLGFPKVSFLEHLKRFILFPNKKREVQTS